MPAKKQILGKKFGRLEAIKEVGKGNRGYIYLFKCDCGQTKEIPGSSVTTGRIQSCGCLRSETTTQKNKTHGKSNLGAYKSWSAMKTRCTNPNTQCYKNYGARGITFCKSWEDFEKFYADMGDRPDGMTLERVNNDLPYSKDNCIWATPAEQNRNTRQNVILEKNGKRMCLTDWAKELKIPYPTLQDRVRRGWPVNRVLDTPVSSVPAVCAGTQLVWTRLR